MSEVERDEAREHRIDNEAVVDAYGEVERAMGWYYYLEEKLTFPFSARCIARRPTSPLTVGDRVKVMRMPPEEECEHEMFVTVLWKGQKLAIPLSQLEVIDADDKTREGVEDWNYWVSRGYQF